MTLISEFFAWQFFCSTPRWLRISVGVTQRRSEQNTRLRYGPQIECQVPEDEPSTETLQILEGLYRTQKKKRKSKNMVPESHLRTSWFLVTRFVCTCDPWLFVVTVLVSWLFSGDYGLTVPGTIRRNAVLLSVRTEPCNVKSLPHRKPDRRR